MRCNLSEDIFFSFNISRTYKQQRGDVIIYVTKWAVRGVDSFPLSVAVELRSMEGSC